MHLHYSGVNDAFSEIISSIENWRSVQIALPTVVVPSRVGYVKQVEEPVTITYERPRERVLFNLSRDANPFFHLYESIWMLAGRNDVAPLSFFNSQIAGIASDDGITFNGAYGYRWRKANPKLVDYDSNIGEYLEHETVDQLKIIIDQLKRKPESRRCVLQMWNVEDDLLKIDDTKDVCCNTNIYFAICRGKDSKQYLDMTVCNRSNDLIWGMLGANFVHFSILQEYMASQIGVEIGFYNQFTNNLHAYIDRWHPEEWLASAKDSHQYSSGMNLVPLVFDPNQFDKDLMRFASTPINEACLMNWKEPFFQTVLSPMCWAFVQHKNRNYSSALNTMNLVAADDWRIAGTNWLLKRKQLWESKNVSSSTD